MNNGHQRPRLAVPGQLPVNITHADNGLASPVCAAINTPGGVQVLVMGGLTKLEHVAAMMMASDAARDAGRSVELAKQLLAACAEAQKPQQGADAQRCGAIVAPEGQ